MEEIKVSNVSVISVDDMVKQLSTSYSKLINNNIPVKTMPSVMLWSAPGLGKSQGVREIAKEIEINTGKKVVVTDVRLLLFNPIDLRGIPTSNVDKTLAIWLKPQIFQMDESNDVVNILFLDEISAAPQSVQAAAYQITLDRVIGEHKLPENCIVIAAGNRVTDKSVAYKMPKALANRLLHIEIESNFDSWERWAISKGINEKVIGFLSFDKNALMTFNTSNDDLAFATPRSWEMVSNILNNINDNVNEVFDLIVGLIGLNIASEFRRYCALYKELPSIEDIFNGIEFKVPSKPDAKYALISSMVKYARSHKYDIDKIKNSIVYLTSQNFTPEYSIFAIREYLYLDKDYREFLLKIPEFNRWIGDKGQLLNGLF